MKTASTHSAQWILVSLLTALTACQSAPESQAQPPSEPIAQTETAPEQPCTVTADGNLPYLAKIAEQDGSVSLMLALKIAHAAEGSLDADEKAAQRQHIGDAQQEIVTLLAAEDSVVARFVSIPFIALRVTPETLNALFCHPLVESIREQRGYESK